MTELEAVNIMLASSGQGVVNSLVSSRADAQRAHEILKEVSRDVQIEGWNFNTEFEVPFTPDGSGNIVLPANAMYVELPGVRAEIRGTKLYDTENRTFVFTGSSYKATVVYLLDFTDLPEAAKVYIAKRASRVYQQRYLRSQEVNQFILQEEVLARANMVRYETDIANYTIFDNNPGIDKSDPYRYWRQ